MHEKKKIEWWPIGIIAAMLTFMGSVLFAVSVMVGNEVSLTSEDYYAKEIAYQAEIDKSSRALAADRKPILRQVAEVDALEISFPGRKQASTFAGKATFFRPSDPKQDFKVDLNPDAAGLQAISLSGRSAGLWLVQLEWSEDSLSYYHEQQIIH
jgi:hypothetical protein